MASHSRGWRKIAPAAQARYYLESEEELLLAGLDSEAAGLDSVLVSVFVSDLVSDFDSDFASEDEEELLLSAGLIGPPLPPLA